MESIAHDAPDKGRNDPLIKELTVEARAKILSHATEAWLTHSKHFIGDHADSLRALAKITSASQSSQPIEDEASPDARIHTPPVPDIVINSPPRTATQPVTRSSRGRNPQKTATSIASRLSPSPIDSPAGSLSSGVCFACACVYIYY